MDHRTESTLHRLLTILADAQDGYREGADLAEHPTMVALLGSLFSMHLMHARRLADAMQARGFGTENTGSALGLAHRAVLRIRSILSGLDENILPGLVDGESRIAEAYDAALEAAGEDEALRALLETQRAAILERIAELKSLVAREPETAGHDATGGFQGHLHQRKWL